jgi:general secretion pathway protein G
LTAVPKLRRDAGLTILELMIVLVILSLVGTVVGVQVLGQMDRAKVDVATLQLRQIQNALAIFKLDTHGYPTSSVGLVALLTAPEGVKGWRGPYLTNDTLLTDPWGNAVNYAIDDEGVYLLSSLGADGRKGGDGAAADLVLGATE